MAPLGDETARQLIVVFGGQVGGLVLGLASSAMLARGLGPANLSVFSVAGAAVIIAITISDFGLSISAVRTIAGRAAGQPEQAQATAGMFAQLKTAGALLVFVLCLLLAQPIAALLDLPAGSGAFYFRVASLGIMATALAGVTSVILRALRRFRLLTLTQLLRAGLIVLLTGALFFAGRLGVTTGLLVGTVATLIVAGVSVFLLAPDWRRALVARQSLQGPHNRELLAFSRWMWVSTLFSVLLSQLDLLVLNRLMPAVTVGIYALALNLAFKADIVNQTLHTVLLPTASALPAEDPAAYRAYLRRNVGRSALLALGMVLLLPLARPFILTVYGAAYASSVGAFYALMAVVFFDLFTMPFMLLAFPMNMPRTIVAADIAGIAALAATAAWLIPAWGIYGAVAARLAGKVAGALILGGAVAIRLRHQSPTGDS